LHEALAGQVTLKKQCISEIEEKNTVAGDSGQGLY